MSALEARYAPGVRPALAQLACALLVAGCTKEPSRPPPSDPEPAPIELERAPLERFFERLRDLEAGRAERVAAAQLGASHTARMTFPDQVRAMLAARFGSRGQGFVSVGAPFASALKEVELGLSGRWELQEALYAKPGQVWGLAGKRARGQPGAKLSARVCQGCPKKEGLAQLSLFYLEHPRMGRLEVLVDGAKARTVPPKPPKSVGAQVATFELSAGPHAVEAKVRGAPVTVFGVAYERQRPGVVYDAWGLPGASVMVPDGYDKRSFIAQLRARQPDLYVVFFGTNESIMRGLDPASYRSRYTSMLRTLRTAALTSDCVLVGPTDRLRPTPDGGVAEAPHLEVVEESIREAAKAHGCAFWSAREAMGGRGSMARWQAEAPPLAKPDGTHLTDEGYRKLATELARSLLAAYDGEGEGASPRPSPRGSGEGSED